MIGYEVVLLEGCEDGIFPRKYHPSQWAPENDDLWHRVSLNHKQNRREVAMSKGKGSLVQH
jgi:hypothetical protein